jgi:hypothetical protein
MNNDTGRCKKSEKNDGNCILNNKTGYCIKIKKPASKKPASKKPAAKKPVELNADGWCMSIDWLEDVHYSPEPEDLKKRREMIVIIYDTYEQYINIDDTIPNQDNWELPPQLQTKEELINNFRDYIQDFERYANADDMYEWGLPELNKIKYDPTYISNYSTCNKPINISTDGDKLSALKAQIIVQMGKKIFGII